MSSHHRESKPVEKSSFSQTLRTKVLIILLIAFSLLGGTTFIVYHQVLLPSFLDLERQHIKSNVLRVTQAIGNELSHLSVLTNDWAAWDDTYEYIQDQNPDYESSNLVDSTFSLNKLNLILLIDKSGKKVWGKVFAEDFVTPISVPPFDLDEFPADFPLLKYGSGTVPLNKQHTYGLITTGAGPMLCAARPVLDSLDNGPSRGTLIMGRLFNKDLIQKIGRLTGIHYTATPIEKQPSVSNTQLKENFEELHYREAGGSFLASTTYTDILGEPALEITVIEKRDILDHGIKALRIALMLMVVGILLSLSLVMLTLQKSVVNPIKQITQNILSWRESRRTWTNPNIGGRVCSEITLLAEEFGLLIERLDNKIFELGEHQNHLEFLVEAKTQKLINTQSMLLQRERLTTLGRLTATISHEILNPLATIRNAFYVVKNSYEVNDSEKIEQALELAERNIRRSISIVEELNSYARVKQLSVSKASLDHWLKGVLDEQIIPDDIEIKIDLSSEIQAMFDQEKLRQVLVNIINNSIDALQESPSEERQLEISTSSQVDTYEIRISDNGVGMSEETKGKLFEPLYSTKSFGVGLGMIIVKNIIEQHDGTIDVDSRENEGTSIVLRLPITLSKEADTGIL